jgi:hypothetical protein
MKKITLALFSIALFIGCKKETVTESLVSANGFWKGVGFGGVTLALLNKTDGTARLYVLFSSSDTATAMNKLDGKYTLNQNVYKNHLIDTTGIIVDMQSSRLTANYMDGVYFVTSGESPYFGATFEVVKQP